MEVKPGYKQSEVGVIPEDWETVPIGSLGTFAKGQSICKDEAASGDIPCVRYGEIYTHHNDILRSFNSKISAEVARSSKRLKKGDLLFTGSGETKEEIGKCVAFLGDEEAYAGGDIVILSPSKGVSSFFGYLFNAPIVARQKASKGQGDAVVHISASALSSIKIPLPPTEAEQEAIAEALSDTDALIESLEQLIAKKSDLKQAAMQQLLTGQTRLPGFEKKKGFKQTEVGVIPEEWEVKQLGALVSYTNGKAHEQSITDYGRYVVVNSKFISTEGEIRKYSDYCYCPTSVGDVLMVMSDVPNGRAIAKCFWVDKDHTYAVNQRICALHPRQIDGKLLFYKLDRNPFYLGFDDGVKRTNLRKDEVLSCPLGIPKSNGEQTAIAGVLSDMDAEIAALEQRLAKTRGLKKGMMQELLTGKTRLI